MKRRKWWLIPFAIILVLLILAAVFWQTLIVYAAPKTVLTAALTDMISDLEIRYASGPLPVLAQGIDPEWKNTVDLQLDKSNDLLGTVRYDMQIQMEQNPRRILAQGQARFLENTMDLALYLDGTFAALSSGELLQGKYYGLTYKSFAEDIVGSKVLQLLVNKNAILQWKESVSALETVMNQSVSIPDISQLEYKKLLLGIMALEAEVDREQITVDGEILDCFEISFDTTGRQLLQGLAYINNDLAFSIDPNSEITVSFYLNQGNIMKIVLDLDSEFGETEMVILPGRDPARDDIHFLLRDREGYKEISVSTSYDDHLYREAISFSQAQHNEPSEWMIRYDWNRTNGETQLSVTKNGEQTDIFMVLQKAESGFCISTNDFEGLLHILIDTKDTANSSCTLTVRRGAQVETPEYKNFNQWSLEDMVTLIDGIGSLLGIKIA